ncbi:MAG: hypothetical protein OEW19_05785, partial [Acidobacteriota bacterium]|nr:hypothetical protein [Acidobacteriota bacterium]
MTSAVVRRLRAWSMALAVAAAGTQASAAAQVLPTDPISVANGTVVLGGEVTATFGSDDPGFFNYIDYEFSGLRNLRMALSAEV